MLIASKDGEVIYGAYQFEDVDDMSPGDVRSILLDSGYYSILLLSGDNKIIDRWTVSLQSDDSILVSEQPQGMIEVIKPDEKEIKSLFLTQPIKGGEDRDWGGTLFSSGEPLKDRHYSLELPQGVYDIVMLDDEATFYFRRVDVTDSKIVNTLGPISSKPGTKLVITNNGKKDICRVYIRRSDDWAVSSDYPVDVLDYFEDAIGSTGGTLEFKVEPGTYDLAAYDCDGKVVDVRNLVTIGGEPYPWTLVKPCENIGDVKIGETTIPIKCPTENQTNSTDATWSGCYASGQAEAGTMTISICVLNKLIEYIIGFILIDPDGYVYDAGVGFEALIQGATVTCDMYDEDYQTWSRWPAELYESQINPQVTGTDGYYAFFVPPGLYRVRAIAYGYDDHTSPDIRVINEVVHYNIPMTGGGGSAVLLPFVVR